MKIETFVINNKRIVFYVYDNKIIINYDDMYGSVEIIGDISTYERVLLIGTDQNPVYEFCKDWWMQKDDMKLGFYKISHKHGATYCIGEFDLL